MGFWRCSHTLGSPATEMCLGLLLPQPQLEEPQQENAWGGSTGAGREPSWLTCQDWELVWWEGDLQLPSCPRPSVFGVNSALELAMRRP